jgi:hypothetical protein
VVEGELKGISLGKGGGGEKKVTCAEGNACDGAGFHKVVREGLKGRLKGLESQGQEAHHDAW